MTQQNNYEKKQNQKQNLILHKYFKFLQMLSHLFFYKILSKQLINLKYFEIKKITTNYNIF
jgi:hypothetical protein